MNSQKIRFWYGVFLGVFTVLIGAAFIFAAADIYYSAEGYTYEGAAYRLKILLAPICLWIVAIVAGFVLSVLYPDEGKRRVKQDSFTLFKRLKKRIPVQTDGELLASFRKGERIRLGVRLACAAVCLAAAIASLVYLCNTANFPYQDLNGEILRMLKNVLPWVAAAFVAACATTVFEAVYAKKMLPSVKKLIATGKGGVKEPSKLSRKTEEAAAVLGSKHVILAVRLVLLAVGITLVFVGIFNGGARDVFIKAINICTECIGLG